MRTPRFLPPTVLLISLTIPPGAAAQSEFVNEVADGSANNVGQYTSLALDAQGNPHVSYFDDTFFDLKYARKSGGAWTIETAEGSALDVGRYTSLALDAQGNPHVSHLDASTFDLKYTRKSGGVWTTETADASANLVGTYTSLALDAQGNPHVSYWDQTNGDLKFARKSGGVWTTEIADGSANNVGIYPSLALDAQGNPHVSYQDATTGDLRYARKSGAVWTTETADGSATSVGQFTSLALDAQGNPHVSYHDQTTGDLKFARKSGGVWTTETADASANLVGSHTSLALDAQGNPHVSYYNGTLADLKYARKSGAVWTIEIADGSANFVGLYTSLALDAQGNPHVSYYDNTTGDLKFADAAVHLLSPAPGVTWPVGSRQEVSWAGVGTVDLYLTSDGSSYEEILADNVIASPIAIRVPHIPSRFARLILLRTSPFSTSTTDSFFRIDATIALLKFDASAVEGATERAVRLTWETAPGPEADVRYKLERGAGGASAVGTGGEFEPIHPGLLDRGEYLDSEAGALSRYRLVAVNGLGEEYVLGETRVAASLGPEQSLGAYPSPVGSNGARVVFRVPLGLTGSGVMRVSLAIYGPDGRRVRTLVDRAFPAGAVDEVFWDRRDDRGEPVAPGTYFLRLLVEAANHRATLKVQVIR